MSEVAKMAKNGGFQLQLYLRNDIR